MPDGRARNATRLLALFGSVITAPVQAGSVRNAAAAIAADAARHSERLPGGLAPQGASGGSARTTAGEPRPSSDRQEINHGR